MRGDEDYRRRLLTTASGEVDHLLTPAQVAALFRVDPKTVTRWAKAGRLTALRTLGGHRRFRESHVRELLDREDPEPDPEPAGKPARTWPGWRS